MTKEEIKALKESGKPLTYCEITREIVRDLDLQGDVIFKSKQSKLNTYELKSLMFKKRNKDKLLVLKEDNNMVIITDDDLFKFPDNAHAMFAECEATSLDLSCFDTSNVTNMTCMFMECRAKSIDLSSFDTSNVTSMNSMFFMCEATSLDLSKFDISKVKSMEYIFDKCPANIIGKDKFVMN